MTAISLGDLFAMTGGWDDDADDIDAQAGDVAPTELHLMADHYDDDGWTTHPADARILTCKRCGSLVPDDNAGVHLGWHRKIED